MITNWPLKFVKFVAESLSLTKNLTMPVYRNDPLLHSAIARYAE